MIQWFRSVILAAIALPAMPVMATAASGIPGPTVVGTFFDGRYDYNGGYGMPTGPVTLRSGPASLAIVEAGRPSVSAACGLPLANYDCYAAGTLTYYFRLDGPGAEIVPLHAHVLASVHQTADYVGVAASVGISNPTSSTGVALGPNTGSAINADFDGTLDFTARVGDLTKVVLNAGIIFSIYDNPAGISGTAYADPYFTIDSAFAAAHPGYSLSFSSGVGNASGTVGGVPEPATWTMMVAGFGLAGARLRRRQLAMARVSA